MTRRKWGIAAGMAALLGMASFAPATAVQTVGSGTLSLDNDEITWVGASGGISPSGVCDDLGGESCFQYDLEVAEGLDAKEIHLTVFPTLVGPGVESNFSMNNSENPEEWTIEYGVNENTTNANPAADFDIWLFKDGVRELAKAHDPDNNSFGSFSQNTGPVFDEIVLFPGELAAGHYDVVVVAKAAAPGTTFQSDIWAAEASCSINPDDPPENLCPGVEPTPPEEEAAH